MKTISIDYVPTPKQRAFHETDANEVLYGGAAGGGKSKAIVMDALMRCLQYPNTKAFIFRRTYGELEDSIIKEAQNSYPPEIGKYNSTKHEFTLLNGSMIMFRHCANVADMQNYRGAEIQWLYFDELTSFEEQQYDFIRSRLRAKESLGIIPVVRSASNPGGIGHGWVKTRFVDAGTYGKKIKKSVYSAAINKTIEYTTQYIPALVTDNPYIGKDYIFELEQKPKALRDAMLYGHWDAFEGQVFTEWLNDPKHYNDHLWTHVINPFEIPKHWNRYMSFDFGYSKPFSCGWWAMSPDGTAYRYKEWYGWNGHADVGLKISPRQIAEGIIEREKEEQDDNIQILRVADPAIFDTSRGESVAQIMEPNNMVRRGAGVYFEKGDNARLSGLQQFHERLRFDKDGKPKMYVFNNCTNFIRTIPNLPYSLKNVEDVDTAAEDHCLVGETLVFTDNGWKKIADMVDTDGYVMSHDGKYHRYSDCRKTQSNVDVFTITTDDSKTVTATANHRFLLKGEVWKRLDELQVGDELYEVQNHFDPSVITKIEYAGKRDVFNMEVEGIHSFVVNGGIVAHNCFDETKYFFMMCPIATFEKPKSKRHNRTPFEKWK